MDLKLRFRRFYIKTVCGKIFLTILAINEEFYRNFYGLDSGSHLPINFAYKSL